MYNWCETRHGAIALEAKEDGMGKNIAQISAASGIVSRCSSGMQIGESCKRVNSRANLMPSTNRCGNRTIFADDAGAETRRWVARNGG